MSDWLRGGQFGWIRCVRKFGASASTISTKWITLARRGGSFSSGVSNNQLKAKLDAEKQSFDEQQRLQASFENLINNAAKSAIVTQKETELAQLEDLKKQKLINDDVFNQRKNVIEQKAADQEFLQQQTQLGRKLEAEREYNVQIAEETIAALTRKIEIAKQSGNFDDAAKLSEQLEANRKVIEEKGGTLKVISSDLQQSLSGVINNLIQNDPEQAKKGMKATLAQIGGYLSRLASAAATRLVLGSEIVLGLVAAAGPFLGPVVLAGLTASINALVNSILSPVLGKLLSFGTGGIATEPLLALVGDRGSVTGRDNTEFILGSDQMQLALQQALSSYDTIVAHEVRLLREDLRNRPVVVEVDGQVIMTAVQNAEWREKRREVGV